MKKQFVFSTEEICHILAAHLIKTGEIEPILPHTNWVARIAAEQIGKDVQITFSFGIKEPAT